MIEARSLQARIDTKFVLHADQVPSLLEQLSSTCSAITVKGSIKNAYRTLYYDTADYLCLEDHQRGRLPRFKARFRHHVDREMSFLEVKQRNPDRRTTKHRLPIPFLTESLNQEGLEFIQSASPLPSHQLTAQLHTLFKRVTLLDLTGDDRVTIDSQIRFSTAESQHDWPELSVIEVKQARFDPRTATMLAIRNQGGRQLSLSKYCIGAHLLLPEAQTAWYGHKIHMLRTRLDA